MTYPGGKGLVFRRIINLLPPHSTYIETHLGAGAVIRHKRPAMHDIGIDIDPRVTASWASTHSGHYDVRTGCAHRFLETQEIDAGTVIYCDPPYMLSTRRSRRRYRFDYTDADHESLLAILRRLPCKVVLSGYSHGLYESELRGWNTISFRAKTHASTAQERLWFNFEPPAVPHDSSFLGDTFREREQVKRRLSSLKRKIEKLTEAERSSLLDWAQGASNGSLSRQTRSTTCR